jgi:hypothetical protein
VSDRLKPEGNEPKAFPIWKWAAALGGIYFAYSVGYTAGQESHSDSATSAAYNDSAIELPADEALIEPVAVAAAADQPVPIAQASTDLSLDPGQSNVWSEWQSDTIEGRGDEASAAVAAARDEAFAAEAAAAVAERDTYRTTPSAFASIRVPERETASPQLPQQTATTAYVPQVGCAENGSCYGDVSAATGRPKTVSVGGYYRRDGTYVRGHYRSRPSR